MAELREFSSCCKVTELYANCSCLKRPLHVQAICANLFAQIAGRLAAADGTSMWCKPSGCSSYGVNFFNSFLEHALIELIFWGLHIFFSTFRYFTLYLFSNLAFCSFFLFLLLYSELVTHTIAQGVTYILL